MFDFIFVDEGASTSTNQNYRIDIPDIFEMVYTQNPEPMRNTE